MRALKQVLYTYSVHFCLCFILDSIVLINIAPGLPWQHSKQAARRVQESVQQLCCVCNLMSLHSCFRWRALQVHHQLTQLASVVQPVMAQTLFRRFLNQLLDAVLMRCCDDVSRSETYRSTKRCSCKFDSTHGSCKLGSTVHIHYSVPHSWLFSLHRFLEGQ